MKIRRVIDHFAPFGNELHAIALRTRTPHSWTFRAIEHTKLNGSSVGNQAHLTAKSIYLPDYLAFSYSTNGWIATHLSNFVHIHGNEQRARTHISRSTSRFTARMTSTNHYNVVLKSHRF